MTARRRPRATAAVEIIVRSTLWRRRKGVERVVRRALNAASRAASKRSAGIAIVLADDSALRKLNRTWRRRDKATNVLSFPAASAPGGQSHLGDIVLAFETLVREAEAEKKPFSDHLAHLVVHGYLHLVGHDHEIDADARRMERLETRILSSLGVPDPYRESAASA